MTSGGTWLVALASTCLGVVLLLAGPGPEQMIHADDRFAGDGYPYVTAPSDGYDGQFYYRLAAAPFSLDEYAAHVRFDSAPYRHQRIGYPIAAWILSAGQASLVPYALVAANLAAFAAIGASAASMASRSGRSPWWGIAVVSYPGFAAALRWDLGEAFAAAALLGGLALIGDRPTTSAALFVLAVLSRETTAVVPAALAGAWILRPTLRHSFPARLWVAPLSALAAWQAGLWWMWGAPGLVRGGQHLDWPFAGILYFVRSTSELGDLCVLVLIVAVAAVAARELRKAGWLASLTTAVLVSEMVWTRALSFSRASMELWLISSVVILTCRRRGNGDQIAVAPALRPDVLES